MPKYRTVKTCNGYTLQKLNKILCFTFWRNVCTGTYEAINSYINGITGRAFIVTDFWFLINRTESAEQHDKQIKNIFKKCLKTLDKV